MALVLDLTLENPAQGVNLKDSVISARLALPVGMHRVSLKKEDGKFTINDFEIPSGDHAGKMIYLCPVIVDVDGMSLEGEIAVGDPLALKDAAIHAKNGSKAWAQSSTNKEGTKLYLTLVSNLQGKILNKASKVAAVVAAEATAENTPPA